MMERKTMRGLTCMLTDFFKDAMQPPGIYGFAQIIRENQLFRRCN